MKTNRLMQAHKLIAVLTFAAAVMALLPPVSHAAAFTAGNLVIYRTGDGVANLINTGNPVFLDEYTPAGTLVQSVAMPMTLSGVQFPLIASGTATSEGLLTRSADGQYLIVPGYGTTTGGGTSLPNTASTAVPRVVGRVNSTGVVDTSTSLTNWATGNNPRSATSADGTAFWVGGGVGGVCYVSALGASNCVQINTGIGVLANIRQVNIFSNQLYYSDSSTSAGNSNYLGAVGTGLPTTPGQNSTTVITTNQATSLYSYFFADLDAGVAGLDTLYVADDARGILKFSLVAGNWTANCTNGVAADFYRGLTATVSGTTVTLYATRKGGQAAAGGGELVSLVDTSGYNTAFAGTPTLLATAVTKTAFRGVALAPVTASSPQISYLAITSISLSGGTNVVITGTNEGPGTFYVLADTNVTTPRLNWTSVATNTTGGSGTFSVTATNAAGPLIPQRFYLLSTTNNL